MLGTGGGRVDLNGHTKGLPPAALESKQSEIAWTRLCKAEPGLVLWVFALPSSYPGSEAAETCCLRATSFSEFKFFTYSLTDPEL